jgi:Protein of unknown function (DUF3431)
VVLKMFANMLCVPAGCCAEFVVRRDRIRARPRKFYSDLLERLNSIPQEEPAPAFALEHSWHAIFVSALSSSTCCEQSCCTRRSVCMRECLPWLLPKLSADVLRLAHVTMLLRLQLQGEPWVTLGIGKCQLVHCRWAEWFQSARHAVCVAVGIVWTTPRA